LIKEKKNEKITGVGNTIIGFLPFSVMQYAKTAEGAKSECKRTKYRNKRCNNIYIQQQWE
jgi:hypothetical protein